MKRKIISVLICIMMLVNTLQSFASFNISSHKGSDVLFSLGIMNGDENGNLRLDDFVTRAEFAKMAVMASEHKNKVSFGAKVSVFPDCPASHWASPYVAVAVSNGILEGHSDGTFGPEDNITYAQAITVMLRLLGYGDSDFANAWPEGQISMASSLKLDSSVNKTRDEFMTRRDIVSLIVNTLGTSKKSSSSEYISSLGYTIINDCLIVATEEESTFVNKGKILTSSGEYDINEETASALNIGDKGDAVVSDEGRLVCFVSYGYGVEESCVYSSGSGSVVVYSHGSVKLLDCDDMTVCYKNGQKTTYSGVSNQLQAGDKIYITTGNDGSIDSLVIGESDFTGPATVYGTDEWKEVLGVGADSYVVRNSVKVNENELKDYDIVYYSESLNTVFAYSKRITGVYASAYPSTDSPERVTVSGTEYNVETSSAYSKLRSGSGIEIGDSVTLILGRNGDVADVIGSDGYKKNDYSPDGLQLISTTATSSGAALLAQLKAVELNGGDVANPHGDLSRGEFAKMAVMASPYSGMVSAGAKISVFSDCPYTHPMAPYVKTAVEKSLMSAFPDFTFRPDEPVSVADAVETLLRILGYTNDDFGYSRPEGQMALAASLGITDGVEKDAYASLSRSDAVTMIYNTLLTKLKSSSVTCLESMGYNYYEDAVIIATSKENSSVGSGKILTSEGTFNVGENEFDLSVSGKKGDILVKSGKLIMFNHSDASYGFYTVYSVISGGVAVMDEGNIRMISLSDSTVAYADTSKSSFFAVKDKLLIGDSMTVCYDASLRPQYIHVHTSSLRGPYVADGASAVLTQIEGVSSGSEVVRNGKRVSISEIEAEDILYYSKSLDTVYAYSDKLTGIFEGASPSQDSPDSVTISGVKYELEGLDAVTAFSSGSIDFGETVSVCFGRDGKIAYARDFEGETLVGYIVSAGIKTFTNSNGESYTSRNVQLALPDASLIDVRTSTDYSSRINSTVSVTFSGDDAEISVLSSGYSLNGKVDAENMKIGSYDVSDDVNILDVGYDNSMYPTVYTSVYLKRLDGITLNDSTVLYFKAENNVITDMILLDATGDAFSYGIITNAPKNYNDRTNNASYTCTINGASYSYNGGVYANIYTGSAVKTAVESGKTTMFSRLTSKSASVSEITYSKAVLSDGSSVKLSDSVSVYKVGGTSTYTLLPLSEIVENTGKYKNYTLYSDKSEDKGGRVRIIIVK